MSTTQFGIVFGALILLVAYCFYCAARMSLERIPGATGFIGLPGSLTPKGMRYARRFLVTWLAGVLLVLYVALAA